MEQIKGRSSIEQVKEFHEVFGHPVADKVGEETLETRQLRIKLLFEELEELAIASGCDATFRKLCDDAAWLDIYDDDPIDGDVLNHVEELDALCDLQVVLDGKFLTSGHWKVKDQAFAEVHRSNMSKSGSGDLAIDQIEDHCAHLEKTKGNGMTVNGVISDHFVENEQGKIIFVREDGKILKGPDFSEPNLKQFVDDK